MKIMIELEVDQEAYDRKYGPGTEWWGKYMTETTYDTTTGRDITTIKPASEYYYAPDRAKAQWDCMLRDILTEGLYDWTQLHEEALKITITIPEPELMTSEPETLGDILERRLAKPKPPLTGFGD